MNNNSFSKYIKDYTVLLDQLNMIDQIKTEISKFKNKKEKKILLFGNGGTSSTCSHIATDLVKVNSIQALSFNDHNLITCFANDYGFENWIAQALKSFCNKRDLVILVSSSGESKNMINAAKYCKKNKINLITLTGFKKNNSLSKLGNKNLWINSNKYNYVESAHFQVLAYIVDTI